MNNFFDVKSVAIIGASANPKKLGHQILKNLIKGGFSGRIFPINLKEHTILGLPTYQSVLDVNAKIEMAVVVVPREIVPEVVLQCVHKEIPYVLIITAGFAEKDNVGKKLSQRLLKTTLGTKTKIIGPNTLGIIDNSNHLNLTFALSEVLPGEIGLILQSGAIGAAIFDWAKENSVGISKFISLGNKIHLDELDALELLGNDPVTKVIAIYLEEISNPAKFMVLTHEIGKIKPIIFLKGGVTSQGAKAATSHTAALSTSHELTDALCDQANLLVARDFEELLNFLSIFSTKVIDLAKNNLAIITNAGGPGILAADGASCNNLKVLRPSRNTESSLKQRLKTYASISNPFDLGGDALAENYREALEIVEKSQEYSAIAVILTPQTATEIEKTAHVITTFNRSKKSIIASFLGGAKIIKAIKILTQSHIPHYDDPAEGLRLLGKIYNYHQKKTYLDKTVEITSTANQTKLTDEEIIGYYKLPYIKSINVSNDAELMGHVDEIGFPLVYKTAKKITHKGKKHLVGLNIGNHDDLQRAVSSIGFPGVLQPMIESPFEIICGAKRDPRYGVVTLFGQGGIFTEEEKDIQIKILPLTERDLHEMIEETKIWKAISDRELLIEFCNIIIKLARIITENQDISEIELNPIKILSEKKLLAVDINIKRL